MWLWKQRLGVEPLGRLAVLDFSVTRPEAWRALTQQSSSWSGATATDTGLQALWRPTPCSPP